MEMAHRFGDASPWKSAGPRTGEHQAEVHATAPAAIGPGLAARGSAVPRTRSQFREAEGEAGRLGAEKATSPGLKEISQQLTTDHQNLRQSVQELAQKIALPCKRTRQGRIGSVTCSECATCPGKSSIVNTCVGSCRRILPSSTCTRRKLHKPLRRTWLGLPS